METSKGVTQADKNALDHLRDGLSMMNNPEHPAWAALTHVKARLAHTVDATDGEREAETIARAMDPPLWSDDEQTAHMAASPLQVCYARERGVERARLFLGELAAPLSRQPAAEAVETFASIIQWGDETFGHATPERVIERAGEEWDEMLEPDADVPTEAADVIIVLLRMPGVLDALQRKMAVNRSRKWDLKGDGTGYHIPTALNRADNAEGGLDLLEEGGAG